MASDAAGRLGFVIQNIGESSIRGIEVDGRAVLTRSTRAGAAVQYLDSTYTSFRYKSPIVDTVPGTTTDNSPRPRLGCPYTATSDGTGYDVNCDGYPGFSSPKWTYNLNLVQTFSLSWLDLVLAADTQYRSGYYLGFEYLPNAYCQPGWRSNLSITAVPETQRLRWSVNAYVRNIENTRSIAFATTIADIDTAAYTEPRTIGLTLRTEF